jgi:hypothetical protein
MRTVDLGLARPNTETERPRLPINGRVYRSTAAFTDQRTCSNDWPLRPTDLAVSSAVYGSLPSRHLRTRQMRTDEPDRALVSYLACDRASNNALSTATAFQPRATVTGGLVRGLLRTPATPLSKRLPGQVQVTRAELAGRGHQGATDLPGRQRPSGK